MEENELFGELLGFTRCRSPEELAATLRNHFGSAAALTSASLRELRSIRGMDRDTARFIRLVGEISGRAVSENEARAAVKSPRQAAKLLGPRLRGMEHEALSCLCLDKLLRPVDCTLIAEGDRTRTSPESFAVVRAAHSAGSRLVILAHNHPPEAAYPSAEDIQLTKALAKALKDAEITLLDHIVFSREGYVSMAESALLPPDPLRDPYLSQK